MHKEFVTDEEIHEMGVPFELLSAWMTNDLLKVAYQAHHVRFFWKKDVERLKVQFNID
ncbi:hypothetical protein [Macrococcoides caseolyticum]|uniref:hypothetical protein n=1 Tax=Macrococcoides caseolyticum TaxID=69966 RepID=UPI001F3090F9|nr:hypothetical protein [Macrococcus caseolyticus]MCE4956570.1 hypothetical protein [Macrococcus caseolyticus]